MSDSIIVFQLSKQTETIEQVTNALADLMTQREAKAREEGFAAGYKQAMADAADRLREMGR